MKTHNFVFVNCDTDALMVRKPDGAEFSEEERNILLQEINDLFPEHIEWDDNGYYSSCIILKAKNYILLPYGEKVYKLKGSSIKTATKEVALKEMMLEVIENLIFHKNIPILDIYHKYIKEALNPENVRRWCQKKSVSESVLNCKGYEDLSDDDEDSPRKNESDIWDAIKVEEGVQQGDKVYLYPVYLGEKSYEEKHFKKNKETGEKEFVGYKTKTKDVYGLRMDKYYKNDIATEKLIRRVYDTMKIFESIIDISLFPKYHNKTNKELLENLNNE